MKKTSRLLADATKPILDKIELGKTALWNFTASDGTVITEKMCLSPDFDPNKKYPLIVYYYGGTTPTTRGIGIPYCAQLFASRDYVVYVIQPSGTIAFGQEFSAHHFNAWRKRTANDIIEGTKLFTKQGSLFNIDKINTPLLLLHGTVDTYVPIGESIQLFNALKI